MVERFFTRIAPLRTGLPHVPINKYKQYVMLFRNVPYTLVIVHIVVCTNKYVLIAMQQ